MSSEPQHDNEKNMFLEMDLEYLLSLEEEMLSLSEAEMTEEEKTNIYDLKQLLESNLTQSQLTSLIKDKLKESGAHPNVRALWDEIISGIDGKNVGIPIGDDQLDKNIQIRKNMLICIGGLTGSAKSALLDDIFVLKLFKSWLSNEHDDLFPNIEWTYFSMERSPLHKRAKWLCWLLYNDYGVPVSIGDLLSWQRGQPIKPGLLPYIPRLLEYLDLLEDKIDLIGGEKYANEIYDIICSKMNRIGYHIHCNTNFDKYTGEISGQVLVNGEAVGKFDNEVYEENRIGTKKYYVDILIPQSDGINLQVRVFENDKKYVPFDSKKVNVIVVDHISKVRLAQGQNRKEANDQTADMLAELRDYYGITVIIVNQFNRSIYSEDPTRLPEGLVPMESHFADSSSILRNADLVLGILDPIRLSDYSQAGYDVAGCISRDGYCTLRTVHIVKSTFGGSGAKLGFSFIGESGYFRTLPPANYMTDNLYYLTVNSLSEVGGKTFEELVAAVAA